LIFINPSGSSRKYGVLPAGSISVFPGFMNKKKEENIPFAIAIIIIIP